jgi:hypothetical protein
MLVGSGHLWAICACCPRTESSMFMYDGWVELWTFPRYVIIFIDAANILCWSLNVVIKKELGDILA